MTSTSMTGRIDEFSNDDSSSADGNGLDWLFFAIEEQEGGNVVFKFVLWEFCIPMGTTRQTENTNFTVAWSQTRVADNSKPR